MYDPTTGAVLRARILYNPVTGAVLRAKPKVKTSREPAWRNYPAPAKSKRKTHKGVCILFEGVRYQTLSSFAKDHGFDSGGKKNVKMAWYKQQLSKRPLKDRLRFLSSQSLTSIRLAPQCVREGLVDAKHMVEIFAPATRKRNTGNADLFKITVLERYKHT